MAFLKDRRFVLGAVLSVLLILLFVFTHQGKKEPETIQALSAEQGSSNQNTFDNTVSTDNIPLQSNTNYYVDAVVGSDTVVLRTGGTGTLFRLLGVQSPARAGFGNCYDQEAASSIVSKIAGSPVTVAFDTDGGVSTDGVGNPAGYLYLSDGTLLNSIVLQQGYGKYFSGTSEEHASELSTAEQNARLAGRGIWKGKCQTTTAQTSSTVNVNSNPWSITAVKKPQTPASAGSTTGTASGSTAGATTGGTTSNSDTTGLSELPPPPPPPPPPMQ